MRLEVLLSCMHQTDGNLIGHSGLTGDVLMINQCNEEKDMSCPTEKGTARLIFTKERGLTKSRNMAIHASTADVCLLCDDDETFVPDYEEKILNAYHRLPQADVIIFKMKDRPASFPDQVMELKFPKTLKVSSWQISFRRESLLKAGIRFDELLGAGTGNGGEEELKFLTDCRRKGLHIFYVPEEIASVGQTSSTWFHGFDRVFFMNRGATTRYILGLPLALIYGVYYVVKKRPHYRDQLTPMEAMKALLSGMKENKIKKQKEREKEI
jgi:glycosyltransferase involved in cell wall biosynthesis